MTYEGRPLFAAPLPRRGGSRGGRGHHWPRGRRGQGSPAPEGVVSETWQSYPDGTGYVRQVAV